MRWYCLHPELPEKAVLRIRTAPNSGAAVCGRVSKGKAIAALAPEFEIADDTLSLSAADGSAGVPQRWIHVLFPDKLNGESMTEGYVMASLPDGMRLLVPWEQADVKQFHTDSFCSGPAGFINCCRINNASAKLFDGPSKTANAVGLAEEGEGLKYPYGVVAVEGSRACIVHDILESVWIEIAELKPVCVELRHPNCSIPHAFYTLNEDLPPEAQIAIRCFPSKEAETVGLLSRGEVVEVVAQCENWLQVAAAHGKDEEEESWIMCQTDLWTLLVEFPGYSSGKCARLADFSDGNAETAAAHHDQGAKSEETAVTNPIEHNLERSEEVDTSLSTAAAADLVEGSLVHDEMERLSDHTHDQELLEGAGEATDGGEVEKRDVEGNRDFPIEDCAVSSSSWEDRPLNVRSSRGAGESNSDESEQDATTGKKEDIDGDRGITVETRATPSSSWEDRPLNVRSNRENGEVGSGKFEQDGQFQQNQYSSPEEDGAENKSVIEQSFSSETSKEYWDDRPIRPHKESEMNWDEGLSPTQDPVEHQPVDDEKEVQGEAGEETQPDYSNTSNNKSTSGSGIAWDETPVSGGRSRPWDEAPVGVQSHLVTIAAEEVEALHSEPLPANDATKETDSDVVQTETVSSWDEMPVGGSSHRSWEETPVGGGNPRSWDEVPIGVQNYPTDTNYEDVASHPELMNDVSEMEDEDPVVMQEETPVGADSSLPWDERSIGAQSHNSSAGDENTEVWEESMAEDATEERHETQAVVPEKISPWDEMPVGGAGHHSWDETPVGGSNSHSWDETPVGVQSQQTISGDESEASQLELVIVGETAKEDDSEVQTETVSSWDDTPLSASNHHSSAGVHVTSHPEPMSVDEVHEKGNDRQIAQHEHIAVGDSSPRQWDEVPVGVERRGNDEDVEVRAESMMEDVTEGISEDQVIPTKRISSWDDTPVGSSRRRVWDETPVGGGSSRPWDEIPVGARISADHQEAIAETFNLTTEPATQTLDERSAASSLAKLLERDLLSSDQAIDNEPSSPFSSDHDQKGKLTLADLDEFVELERDELPIEVTRSQSPLQSQETTPVESPNESVHVEVDDIVMNEETAVDDTFEEVSSEGWDQGASSTPILPHDCTPARSDQIWGEVQASPEPTLAEEDDHTAAAEEMIVDLTETVDIETHDTNQQSPAWKESPTELASQNGEDEEQFYESQDTDQQLPDVTQTTLATNLSTFTKGAHSVTKRGAVLSGTKSRVENRSSAGGLSFAGRRTRKPQFLHAENGNGGLSFLMEFGIRAYCRHKQILITSNEDVSKVLFEAVVYGDDPEVILEALTADEPPCEDWMTFSSSKVRVLSSEPDAHSFLDVLYARDSGEIPSTPRQMTPQHTQQQLRTPPHSSGTRKAKIDRMFNRTPVKQQSTPTYDLIMNNADVDKILEAEFGNEACELSILGPYKYPTLTGSQMPGKLSRSPVGSFGVVNSGLSRFSVTTFQTPPSKDVESNASIAPGHPLRSGEELPPRFSTPPLTEENANPLKRAASAIAKTPPVQITKTASAPSVMSTAPEAAPKPVSTTLPPASRLGSRPSSTSSLLGTSSTLRRPSSQPTGSAAMSRSADSTLSRPRSSLTSESSATATRSSITGALPRPQSFLQRKSFLPTPSPGKTTTTTPSASRNSIAGSIAQATDTSSLQARRTSFGFVRPKTTTTIPKK